jgi:lantibiotic biosynthesis protein
MIKRKTTGNTTRQWQPVLSGAELERGWTVVKEIAEALQRPPAAWIPVEIEGVEPYRIARSSTLAMGTAGLALFYAYLSHSSESRELMADEADRYIFRSCDALEMVPMQAGLYRGISGIAWVVQHLQGFLYEDESDDTDTDPNMQIDRILLEHVGLPENFDLWDGCVGMGVYTLERYPYPGAKKLLELLIDRLDQLSSPSDLGITWITNPETVPRQTQTASSGGYYDLGVAHGIPGVISFLSRVHALGISQKITGKLLEGAVSWLLAQQWESHDGSLFPQFIQFPEKKSRTSGTFGFCHGDLGLAAALAAAADCTGEASWKAKAIETAHASINYLKHFFPKAPFTNPHLCHGTAGLGHLFNRLYQTTGVERFKEEARKWFRYTLDMRKPGTGIAGFSKYGINEDGERSELYDPGFIQGAAGIGLAFLGAMTEMEPGWDRLMLISN